MQCFLKVSKVLEDKKLFVTREERNLSHKREI